MFNFFLWIVLIKDQIDIWVSMLNFGVALQEDLLSIALDSWIKIETAMILAVMQIRTCGCWWSILECHRSAYRCHSSRFDQSFLSEKSLLWNGTFPHNWFQWPDINVAEPGAASLESVDLISITFGRTLIKSMLNVNFDNNNLSPKCRSKI